MIPAIFSNLKPGDRVYTVHRYASKDNNTHVFSVHLIEDGIPFDATAAVAKLIKRTYNEKHGGIALRGYGWHDDVDIVAELSRALFGDPQKLIRERV